MIKRDEIGTSRSCLNKARDDEMLFVLLARDPAAPATIRFWIRERVRLGKNQDFDLKMVEAEAAALAMERGT